MKVKEYHPTEAQLIKWLFGSYEESTKDPLNIVEQIKKGIPWTYRGIPIRLRKE
jgi:hypothetical protein